MSTSHDRRKPIVWLIYALLLLAFSSVAQAGTLYTPPIAPMAPGYINCSVTNVSGGPISVRILAMNGYGEAKHDTGNATVGPNAVFESFAGMNGDPTDPRYCKFEVGAAKASVRASLSFVDTLNGTLAATLIAR